MDAPSDSRAFPAVTTWVPGLQSFDDFDGAINALPGAHFCFRRLFTRGDKNHRAAAARNNGRFRHHHRRTSKARGR